MIRTKSCRFTGRNCRCSKFQYSPRVPSASLPRSVLVVGSGGREHAIVLALQKSPAAPKLFCAPGNPGIAELATCVPTAADDIPGLVALAQRENIEFVVVGPEVPLSLGLVDELAKAESRRTAPRPTAPDWKRRRSTRRKFFRSTTFPRHPPHSSTTWSARSNTCEVVLLRSSSKRTASRPAKAWSWPSRTTEAEEAVRALISLPGIRKSSSRTVSSERKPRCS